MRLTTRICIGLVALLATSGRAHSQTLQLAYEASPIPLAWPEEKPATLWERFERAFELRAEKVFTDRFHSLNTMNWYFELADRDAAGFHDHLTPGARRALSRSVVLSVREVALDLPFLAWLRAHQGFFADLVVNSMDSVGEESVAPLNPAYRFLERAWWEQLAENRGICYGLRPFQRSPYAFVSAGIRNGDSLLMLAHVRYHYRHFAEHQFELALSLPLAHGMAIELGTAYQFGRHAETSKLVFKLAKQFRRGGIVHVGMEAQEHPAFLVGMTLPL